MSKQARGDKTVEQLLDTALALVKEHGVSQLAVQQLSARSGVSMGSLYHHFGSRDGVVFALYRRSLEHMLGSITAVVLEHRSARAGVRALVKAYLAWIAANPDEARVIYGVAEADLSAAHRAEVNALGERLVAPLAAWLAPHAAAGRVIAIAPGLIEILLIGPAAEAARRILAGAPGYGFEEATAVLPDAAWRSVRSYP